MAASGIRQKEFKVRRIDTGKEDYVKIKDLGISYPVVVTFTKEQEEAIPNPYAPTDQPGQSVAGKIPTVVKARKCTFVIQFAWKPTTEAERDAKQAAEEKAKLDAKNAAANAVAPTAE